MSEMPPNPTCSSCRWFSHMTNECRGDMPKGVPIPDMSTGHKPGDMKILGFWPATAPDKWCGKHSRLTQPKLEVVSN